MFGFRILTVKNSRKRSAARSPAPATKAGTVTVARSVRASAGSAFAAPPVFLQESFKQRFRPSKTRMFQFVDGFGEFNQAAFRREIEQAQRTGNAKAFS